MRVGAIRLPLAFVRVQCIRATCTQAGLIVAYASSGRTASLVAKYRPTMPILTLVVPAAAAGGAAAARDACTLARQCLIVRGVAHPAAILAATPCPYQILKKPLACCLPWLKLSPVMCSSSAYGTASSSMHSTE